MEEIWKDIIGFPNYQISTLGRVRSKTREVRCKTKGGVECVKVIKEKLLTPHLGQYGYYVIALRGEDGKAKYPYLHRLLAQTFIPNPDNKPMIDHKDRNKLNNSLNNLRWATASENTLNKPSRTNEPYIHLYYTVSLPNQKRKCFPSLDLAIKYRDSFIQINLGSEDVTSPVVD